MTIWQGCFWVTSFLVVWTYVGYYLFLWVLSRFSKPENENGPFTPPVSIIITAYNEGANIRAKIDNTLGVDYPSENMEIIIVSDGSTDETNDIVQSFSYKNVRLLALPTRSGKDFSQGQGVAVANGDILILTDTTTLLKKDAINKIVRGFVDPRIGCISGIDQVIDADNSSSGEGAYVRYEMSLRALESRVNSLVVVSGCFFAVRKELCDEWHPDLTSDFYLPIITRMRKHRIILDQEAIGYYGVADDPRKEFHRKVRTIVNGLRVLFRFKSILNPFKYRLFAFQMLNHKLLRWLVPLFLVLAYAANALLLSQSSVYQVFFVGQNLFYIAGVMAYFVRELQEITLFRIPFFFLMTNVAIAIAWYKVSVGEHYRIWEPTARQN